MALIIERQIEGARLPGRPPVLWDERYRAAPIDEEACFLAGYRYRAQSGARPRGENRRPAH